ncbi:MAG: zinc metallopeptidase [Flavobacteriales bacterium]
MGMVYILSALVAGLGMLASGQLKRKFKKYSQVHLQNGMSGKEIAEKMLADNGISDVKVIAVQGQLTDHYNPTNRTVNLSQVVYNERNAAAAAVAAHEVGHAVQHATNYSFLQMRSKLVPIVSFGSKYVQWVLIAGIAMVTTFPGLLLGGIVLFGLTTLFSLVTLPVEFDASRRALVWLKDKKIVTREEHAGSKDALKWAAMTYVAAAVGSLATLLYYVSIYMNRR